MQGRQKALVVAAGLLSVSITGWLYHLSWEPHSKQYLNLRINSTLTDFRDPPIAEHMLKEADLSSECPDTWSPPPSALSETFQYIGNFTYVYSAYFDRRRNLVRVPAMTPRTLPSSVYCLLWYRNSSTPSLTKATFIHWNNKGFEMRSAMIKCSTNTSHQISGQPGESTSKTSPEYVSFSQRKCGPYSNGTLSVEDIQRREKKYKFVVCIHGPLRGNYPGPRRFVEHVEVYTMFGAEKYVVYNTSLSPAMTPFLNYYVNASKMEILKWHIPKGHTHNGGQIALINECLYRYMYKTQYMAFVDLDEFIVPRENTSFEAMLGASKCFNHAEAQIRNAFFPIEAPDDTGYDQNETLKSLSNVVTLRKTARETVFQTCGANSKVITRPEMIWLGTVHLVESSMEPHCCFETHLGLLHHYRHRGSNKVLHETDRTMLKYQEHIVRSLNRVFRAVAKNKTIS